MNFLSSMLPVIRNVEQVSQVQNIVDQSSAPASAKRLSAIGQTGIISLDVLNTLYRAVDKNMPFLKVAEISVRFVVMGTSVYLRCTDQQTSREMLNTIVQQGLNITRLCIELLNPNGAQNPEWLVVSSLDVGLRIESMIDRATATALQKDPH